MTSKTSRGFLMILLSNEQVQQLRSKERLMEPRWLTPWEISKLFKVIAGPKNEAQILTMETLEQELNRRQWKQRKIQELAQMREKSELEELHEFDDYIIQNWNYSEEVKMADY